MGNLKIIKYFSGVIFIGMEGIFILCLYVYLCIAHPICVCDDDQVIYYPGADDVSGELGAA